MTSLILAFLLTLPVFHEDVHSTQKRAQLTRIADAIAAVSETPQEAAMLIATGYAESTFGLRYHEGLCLPHECDGGQARGPWQVWRRTAGAAWDLMIGLENTEQQARIALLKLRWGSKWCKGSPIGTLAFYMGLGCSTEEADARIEERFRIYGEALRALTR
jgi:hypothetical protein